MNALSRSLLLLLLLSLAVASGPARISAQEDVPAPAEDAADAEAVAALNRAVDEILEEVAKDRGLPFKSEFTRKIISPEEIRKFAKEKIDEEFPPEELDRLSALMAAMGFFGPDLSLSDCFSQFLSVGAAGMYDQETKTLYLVEGYGSDGSRPIIYHELVHALEDQHFDLGSLMDENQVDSDRAAGLQAVVEGSAQFLTDRYLAANPGLRAAMMRDSMKQAAAQAKMIREVPVPLVAAMGLYPYFNAPAFVKETTGDDVAKVADLFANLPVSTEQVLHPEKYKVDYPYEIALADLTALLPAGWEKQKEDDSIGELQIGFLLNEFLGGAPQMKLIRVVNMMTQAVQFKGATKTACEGWDGDRVVGYFGPNGEAAFVWASRWDTEQDAGEFAAAVGKGFDYKWDVLKLPSQTGRVEQKGDRVLVVQGFPAEEMERVVAAAWAGTKFAPDRRDKADSTPK